jgi:hypothetical protein
MKIEIKTIVVVGLFLVASCAKKNITKIDSKPDAGPDVASAAVDAVDVAGTEVVQTVVDMALADKPPVTPDMLGPDASPDGPSRLGASGRPALGKQIDRAARAAISTATIATFEANDVTKGTTKDAYNASKAADWTSHVAETKKNLAILDALDGTCGNQLLAAATGDRYAPLAGVLVDDRLYVNSTSGVCGTYLGVEAEAVKAVPAGAGGCGGRTLVDDVIDRSYSVLAAGILTGVDDTIKLDGMAHSADVFPFVAAPNP